MKDTWNWMQLRAAIERQQTGFLFVIGATGVGKTYAVSEITSSLCMDVFLIDSRNCASAQELRTLLQRQLGSNLLQSIAQEQRRRVVIIDEIDSLYNFDRSVFSVLTEIRNPAFLVICTGHASMDKKIRSVLPDAAIIVFSAPSEQDICIFLRSQFPDASFAAVVKAAEACNGNLAHAIRTMHLDTPTQTDETLEFGRIFNTTDRTYIMKIMSADPWLNPLCFHENVPKDLATRHGTVATKERMYTTILQSLCDWDMMMQHVDDPSIALEVVVSSVLQLQSLQRKKTATAVASKDMKDFTKLFSNLSLQKKNEKTMYSGHRGFPWMYAQIFCDYIKYK